MTTATPAPAIMFPHTPDDIIIWPDDEWCYAKDLHEMSHRSDDYTRMPPSFIYVTHGISGYFAVNMWWNPDGFFEPGQTGLHRYDTQEFAIREAIHWATVEEIPFFPPKQNT